MTHINGTMPSEGMVRQSLPSGWDGPPMPVHKDYCEILDAALKLGHSALAILWLMVRHRNHDFESPYYGLSWKSTVKMAEALQMSRSTFAIHLAALKESGFVVPKGKHPLTDTVLYAFPFLDSRLGNRSDVRLSDRCPADGQGVSGKRTGGCPVNGHKKTKDKRLKENLSLLPPENKNGRTESAAADEALLLPASLDTPAFRIAWSKWLTHLDEAKKLRTPTSMAEVLEELVAWGEKRAIAAIRLSIRSGWWSIHEKHAKPNQAADQRNKTREQIIAETPTRGYQPS